MAKVPLKREDFLDDASVLSCEVEAIMAVANVESSGSGFCPDDFPKTLFEGHHFHKLTHGAFDKVAPNISYRNWTKQFYGRTWMAERQRLNDAIQLNRNCALMSASWGMFQIMGSNFAICGYKSVQAFVNAMCKDHNTQLQAFTAYVTERGLADELRDLRWADFARLYNGPSYAVNQYDVKMAAEYARLKRV